MGYSFNHAHLKAKDPRKTAQWYVEMFGATFMGEREVRGAVFAPVRLGDVLINISGPRPGDAMGDGDAELHYGLEHLGISTDNLARDLARIKEQGLRVFETVEAPDGKVTMAFVEAPDNVRLELMQS